MSSESRSNSGSDRSRSNSPNLNQGSVPTPGHGLDGSRSNSPDTANKFADNENFKAGSYTSDRSRSRSASRSRESSRSRKSSNGSKSRSNSPNSNKSWGSPRSDGSHHSNKSKPRSERSRKSRSRSVASSRSAVSSKSGSHRSRSGSGSERSKSAGSNKSRSKTPSNRSGSAGSNRSKSEGSNRSRSGDSRQSRSRSRSKSRSKSQSRSHSVAREHSAEKSRSNTPERSPSHERRSQSPPDRGSRSPEGSVKRSRSREGSHTPGKSPRSPEAPHTPTGTPSRRSRSPEEGSDIERNRDDSIEQSKEPKKSRVIVSDSDNDDEGKATAEASAAALFGDADDISSDEERDKNNENDARDNRSDDNRDERDQRSDDEHEQQPTIEEDEEKEAEEQIPETRIDVEIPKISCDLGRDIHFVKLPNFLSVETRPFDPETYEDEIDEEETLDEEGRARLKLKVENTIRWREVVDNDGNLAKESNARIVKWSDGSLSLHLGAEIFDVYKQPLQGDHNHLFIRQGTGLQGQAVFRTKLSFRPHSTESFTHRKMTLSLADRSQKTSGIKILSQVGADPDQDRKTLLKKEEEKLRQTVRVKPKKRGEGGIGRSHASNAVYREEDGSDEDGAISLNAIKNKYKAAVVNQNKGGAIYSSDEEGSDFETTRSRKQDKSKALKDSESSDDSE